ncbi:ABC transporter ATP-binding protein [Allofustis seminis]|uniref:ABC transporter ATP-binding protein n=1 Tax=Allofustis seminis TaxID=166939 RepID=UPI00037A24CC|nr:ATP-binding cassette domain-containing protein [Allofustis seminis]
MTKIVLKNVSKKYNLRQSPTSERVKEATFFAVKAINLTLDPEAITVILGPSGCGKTTLLRLIMGLEAVSSGEIVAPGMKFGLNFQEPRLMEWLTIYQNVIFSKAHGSVADPKADHLLEMVGLTPFKHAYPHQLSGGMKSRTALIRTLFYGADYLLMDEPFAALDYFTRRHIQDDLLALYHEEKVGMLFVTHSIDEALRLADRILIMNEGQLYNDLIVNSPQRDLLSEAMIALKKEIIEDLNQIDQQNKEKNKK